MNVARDRHRFRVTDVALHPVRDYTGPCPGEHRVGIRVDTAGGAGKVAFRVWANDDFDAPLRTVSVQPNLSFEFVTPVRVTETGFATAYAAVDAPNYVVASAGFGVTCTGAE